MLEKHEVNEADKGEPCWNVGRFEMEQTAARKMLGEPHFIETNPGATLGGSEDMWMFKTEHQARLFFRLRVPYGIMELYFVGLEIPADMKPFYTSLFPSHKIQWNDTPFDEMSHPDDPNFNYTGEF